MSQNNYPATVAERAQLARDGYFVRQGFFSRSELAEIQSAADEAVRYHNARWADAENTVYRSVSVKDGITFVNQSADQSGVTDPLDVFSVREPVVAFARSVAGEGAAHLCWQLVYKHPRFEQPFPWHQDHIHTPADRHFYNMWIALSDMSVENGCLWVLPGIGLNEVLEYHDTPSGKSCWPLDNPNQGVPMEMERGSIFAITSHTLHKSGPNRTGEMRKAMLLAFVDRDALVMGKPVRCTPYPEYVAVSQ
jgi:ectoine hydroxylase-related dioxygenase (phytanoyl-CoA dioxygenase family)